MKFSRFNLIKKSDNESILYNTLTGGLLLFDKQNYSKFIKAENSQNPNILPQSMLKLLKEDGFVIEDDYSENSIIKTRSLMGRAQNELILSVMLTLDCNFSCKYCFEEKRKINMSSKVEENIIAYINKKSKKTERISIDWYGGEPLLRFKQLKRMNDKISEICKKQDTEYSISITTNGYLLNEKVINYLKKFKVSHLQITIDGPPETHNYNRPFATGKPTFQKIFENIKFAINENIPVIVRVNIEKRNSERIMELYKIFEENGFKNKVVILLKSVLPSISNPCKENCLTSYESGKIMMSVYKEAALNGWVVLPYISSLQNYEFCIVDSIGQMIIDPKGYIYKCGERFLKSERVGKILEDGECLFYDYELAKWLSKNPFDFAECKECKILPICMGGCGMKRLWMKEEPPCLNIKYCMDDFLEIMILSEANKNK